MSNAKQNILERLRDHPAPMQEKPLPFMPKYNWGKEELIDHLIDKMKAVRTEIYRVKRKVWLDWLHSELVKRHADNVLLGTNPLGIDIHDRISDTFPTYYYQDPVDDWKENLFHGADIGITSTRGAIAETGSLILWPDHFEPRLLSLAPPTHIAIVDSNEIYETFAHAAHEQEWHKGMPSNALLVSGPSKTADIEQTLAYGIHGPKSLVVAVLVD